jgi:hypothetical protein
MGTAGNTKNWSWVRDRACICGQPACEQRQAEIRAQREAIIAAQDLAFDEPHRMTRPENPLARDLTAAA